MPSLINVATPVYAGAVTATTTDEIAVATVAGVTTDGREHVVVVEATLDLTIGTAGTGVTVRIRRGSGTGGTLVSGIGPLTAAAGDDVQVTVISVDDPGDVVGESYTVTVQVAGATANSTVNNALVQARVQTPD